MADRTLTELEQHATEAVAAVERQAAEARERLRRIAAEREAQDRAEAEARRESAQAVMADLPAARRAIDEANADTMRACLAALERLDAAARDVERVQTSRNVAVADWQAWRGRAAQAGLPDNERDNALPRSAVAEPPIRLLRLVTLLGSTQAELRREIQAKLARYTDDNR